MEKKLTDEEVLTAIELCFKANLECCKCPYFNKNGRNFCIEDNLFYKDMKRIVTEHAELKKKVDDLKSNKLRGEIIMKNVNELMNEIEEHCGDCEAWSGTDCKRNPYTQGCLKDEKQVIECHGMLKGCDMVKQAVKDTAKAVITDMFKEIEGYERIDRVLERIAERYGVDVE